MATWGQATAYRHPSKGCFFSRHRTHRNSFRHAYTAQWASSTIAVDCCGKPKPLRPANSESSQITGLLVSYHGAPTCVAGLPYCRWRLSWLRRRHGWECHPWVQMRLCSLLERLSWNAGSYGSWNPHGQLFAVATA